jgi:hypothetical protein
MGALYFVKRMPTAALRRVKADVAAQRAYDGQRPLGWPCYEARLQAVEDAREAIRRGEDGARLALRQALVDVAAISEELASRMRAPTRRFAEAS